MWGTILGVSVLCIVNVMIAIIVSVDIGAHDNCHEFSLTTQLGRNQAKLG
jgi:hypothetical protein